MKKLLFVTLILVLNFSAFAQNNTVEKSTFGIQTGLLGIWVHNEAKLTNQIVLRSEIGFDSGIWDDYYNDFGFLLTPVLTLEPRWYYNLDKRVKKSRRIDGNSGNFLSIKTSYHPDWFVISSEDNIHVISDITVIPTWGIRRNIGNHFNYETGIGIGYIFYVNQDSWFQYDNEVAINLHLRIGYRF